MDHDKDKISTGLFNVPRDSLKPGEPSDAFLEQYKVYLDYLDKLADRRQTANTFFLTLNTGLCAALAFLWSKDTIDEVRRLYFVIPFAGIVLSLFWYRLVASYRQLSTGKFAVIHEMEQFLPMAPYKAEWEALGAGKDRSKYVPLTHIEVWVPRLFIVMYIVIVGVVLPYGRLWGCIMCSQPPH